MRRYLLGQATEQEDAELRSRADAETIQEIIESDDFADAYHIYSGIDKQAAFDDMLRRMDSEERRPYLWKRYLRYAAAVLILLVAGATYWYSQYTKVTPPEIAESVQLAMEKSWESGKNSAEVEYASVDMSKIKNDDLVDAILNRQSKNTGESHQQDDQVTSITKEDLLAATRITTRHDKEFWLTLDDGTIVHLNYNTRLIYPEKFGKGDRNVILDGEAYFMVAKDKSRPFIVHTMQGDVRVYGTEFYVNSRAENKAMEVALVKGSIGIRPAFGIERQMTPGEQAMVTGSVLTVKKTDVEQFIAWNEGKFAFQEWTLERVMDVLSRWYGYKVEYQQQEIRQEIIDGYFSRYSDLRSTLDGLETALGITITIDNHTIIINK